ncbi:MAG TPA: hypothetical protein VKB79_20855 [Bryobacteraceae bacterium]|nr:hypothetical protein [Bryobacteraceae bacterium]
MNCRQFKGDIIEWARGGRVSAEARNHARSCPDCWGLFEEQSLLSERERSLNVLPAPPDLEARLLEEFVRVRRTRPSRAPWVLVPLAVAAALILVLALKPKPPQPAPVAARVPAPAPSILVSPAPAPEPVRQPAAVVRPRKPRAARVIEEPFVQIPYTQPLAPWERGEIVRMELPVAALIAQGFSIATSDAGAAARADVLVGEDGRARAVRLISISERSTER